VTALSGLPMRFLVSLKTSQVAAFSISIICNLLRLKTTPKYYGSVPMLFDLGRDFVFSIIFSTSN